MSLAGESDADEDGVEGEEAAGGVEVEGWLVWGAFEGWLVGGVFEGWLVGVLFCPYPAKVKPGASSKPPTTKNPAVFLIATSYHTKNESRRLALARLLDQVCAFWLASGLDFLKMRNKVCVTPNGPGFAQAEGLFRFPTHAN